MKASFPASLGSVSAIAVMALLSGCASNPPAATRTAPDPNRPETYELGPLPAYAKNYPRNAGHDLAPGDDSVPTLDIGKLDKIPVPKFQARPQYPFAERQRNAEGEAVIDFIVDENGAVRNVRVAKATSPGFGMAAAVAVSRWLFIPGTKGGKAVRTHLQIPIDFSLNPNEEPPAWVKYPANEGKDIAADDNLAPTYDASKLDQVPVPVFQMHPTYPEKELKARKSGQAVIDFVVDENGAVRNVRVAATTDESFGPPAAAAVSKWLFKPGRKGGTVVRTHLQVPIVFTFDGR